MNYELYKPEQKQEVISLFTDSFADSAGQEEAKLLKKLATDFVNLAQTTTTQDLVIFVATDNHKNVVASIIFSRLFFPNAEEVFLLSPVAVATKHQNQGIGQELIRFGLESLKKAGASITITYGDINFYSKVGFTPITEELIQAPHTMSMPIGWIAQSLTNEEIKAITGKPTCLEPLNNSVYW